MSHKTKYYTVRGFLSFLPISRFEYSWRIHSFVIFCIPNIYFLHKILHQFFFFILTTPFNFIFLHSFWIYLINFKKDSQTSHKNSDKFVIKSQKKYFTWEEISMQPIIRTFQHELSWKEFKTENVENRKSRDERVLRGARRKLEKLCKARLKNWMKFAKSSQHIWVDVGENGMREAVKRVKNIFSNFLYQFLPLSLTLCRSSHDLEIFENISVSLIDLIGSFSISSSSRLSSPFDLVKSAMISYQVQILHDCTLNSKI